MLALRSFSSFASRTALRLRSSRLYSVAGAPAADLRAQIMANIKAAMKSRDTVASTTLRAVMSEVNSADKVKGAPISSSDIALIIRKSLQRRTEAAAQYLEAKREDLAAKEQNEAAILNQLLPPLLSSDAIDAQLSSLAEAIPKDTDPRKAQGLIFKEFYAKVDKSIVDSNLLKERVQHFIQAHLGQ